MQAGAGGESDSAFAPSRLNTGPNVHPRDVSIEGPLEKVGGGTTLFFGKKSRKVRWFVLKNSTLCYYKVGRTRDWRRKSTDGTSACVGGRRIAKATTVATRR